MTEAPITVRPAQPEDAERQGAFFAGLSHDARYHRFMSPLREVPAGLLGEARYVRDGDGAAEFAIAVADAWQGRGLGRRLLAELEDRASAAGVRRLVGDTLRGNAGMIGLARKVGYAVLPGAGGLWTLRLAKNLASEMRIAA
jgi:GNAT superfamily N-acetyltransferase